MMPKPRARVRRRLGWPFGRRQNRRVRTPTHPSLPATPKAEKAKAPGTPGRARAIAVLLLVAAAFGGAVFGGHRFVTRSQHFAVRTLKFSPLSHASADSLSVRAGVALG